MIIVTFISIVGLYLLLNSYYECDLYISEIAKTELPEEWKIIKTYFMEFFNNSKTCIILSLVVLVLLLILSVYTLLKYYQFKSCPLLTFPKKIGSITIFYKPVINAEIASFLDQLSASNFKLYSTNNPRVFADSVANVLVFNEKILENLSLKEIRSIIAHEVAHFKFHYMQKQHLIISKKFERYLAVCGLALLCLTVLIYLMKQAGESLVHNILPLISGTSILISLDQLRFIITVMNIATIVLFIMFVESTLGSIFIKYGGDYMLWQQEFLADAYSALHTDPDDLISALKNVVKMSVSEIRTPETLPFYKKSFGNKLKRIFFLEHPSIVERVNFLETLKSFLQGTVSFRLVKTLRKPHDISSIFFCPSIYFGDLPRFVRKEISRTKLDDIYSFLRSSSRLNIYDLSRKYNLPLFHVTIVLLMLYHSKLLEVEK
jgi:Zn-dependent protease with chaperone function